MVFVWQRPQRAHPAWTAATRQACCHASGGLLPGPCDGPEPEFCQVTLAAVRPVRRRHPYPEAHCCCDPSGRHLSIRRANPGTVRLSLVVPRTRCRAWSFQFSGPGALTGAGLSSVTGDQCGQVTWELATGTMFQPSPHIPRVTASQGETHSPSCPLDMHQVQEPLPQRFNLETDNKEASPKVTAFLLQDRKQRTGLGHLQGVGQESPL